MKTRVCEILGGGKGCRLFLKQEMMINYDVFSFGVSDGSKVSL